VRHEGSRKLVVLSPRTLGRARMRRLTFSNKKVFCLGRSFYSKYSRMLNFQKFCQENSETSSEEDDDEDAGKLTNVCI